MPIFLSTELLWRIFDKHNSLKFPEGILEKLHYNKNKPWKLKTLMGLEIDDPFTSWHKKYDLDLKKKSIFKSQ